MVRRDHIAWVTRYLILLGAIMGATAVHPIPPPFDDIITVRGDASVDAVPNIAIFNEKSVVFTPQFQSPVRFGAPPSLFNRSPNDSRPQAIVGDAFLITTSTEYQSIYSYIQKFYPQVSSRLREAIAAQIVIQGKKNGVNPFLVTAIISHESRFNPQAVGRSGTQGLGQFMPQTYRSLGFRKPFDVTENIMATTIHLKNMLLLWKKSKNTTANALAAYNKGVGSIRRSGGRLSATAERYVADIIHRFLTICTIKSL